MTRLITALILMSLICAFLVGCSSLKKQDPTLNLAINIGVMKVIEEAPATERQSRAQRIVDLADVALNMLDDKDAVVSVVYDRVMAQIQWENLEPSDRLILSTAISQISLAVQERIEKRTLDGDKVTSVKTAVKWVKQAAKVYADTLDGS